MSPERTDPYGAFNFEITIEGVSDDGGTARGSFTEVSGLDVEIDPIDYRNGSEDITPRKIPGLKKFTNITLKRGITGDLAFWNWILSAMDGSVHRADGEIRLLDARRQEVMRWTFRRGWACRYAGPHLKATGNEVAMETLEICHEGLRVEAPARTGGKSPERIRPKPQKRARPKSEPSKSRQRRRRE